MQIYISYDEHRPCKDPNDSLMLGTIPVDLYNRDGAFDDRVSLGDRVFFLDDCASYRRRCFRGKQPQVRALTMGTSTVYKGVGRAHVFYTVQMSSEEGEEAFQRREPLKFHFGSSNLTDPDIATKSWRRVGKPFCLERDVIQQQQGGKELKATPDSQ